MLRSVSSANSARLRPEARPAASSLSDLTRIRNNVANSLLYILFYCATSQEISKHFVSSSHSAKARQTARGRARRARRPFGYETAGREAAGADGRQALAPHSDDVVATTIRANGVMARSSQVATIESRFTNVRSGAMLRIPLWARSASSLRPRRNRTIARCIKAPRLPGSSRSTRSICSRAYSLRPSAESPRASGFRYQAGTNGLSSIARLK